MNVPNQVFSNGYMWGQQHQQQPQPNEQPPTALDPEPEEVDNSHRPPNAFILYTMTMRTKARQENPSLSNTEISSMLGKWWKDVPNDVKLKFKQQAAEMQEKFKREHPDYTYRKARRKRALNELLTKSSTSFPGMPFGAPLVPGQDPMAGGQFSMMPGGFPMFPQQAGSIDPSSSTQTNGDNRISSIGQMNSGTSQVGQQFGFPQGFGGMQFGVQQQMYPPFTSNPQSTN